jgi:hypothetical protein
MKKSVSSVILFKIPSLLPPLQCKALAVVMNEYQCESDVHENKAVD